MRVEILNETGNLLVYGGNQNWEMIDTDPLLARPTCASLLDKLPADDIMF